MHLGSLYTALASYLDARSQNGYWLLRIDDLDTPRNRSGASAAILQCLEVFGLYWDGEVYYQSQHLSAYQQAIGCLQAQQLVFACDCSRKDLENFTGVYPGFCRNKTATQQPSALRLKAEPLAITFHDTIQGWICENLADKSGDFIIKRKDDIIAYQLAVVVDDYYQGINNIVRGCDLLDSTAKQIYLQRLLKYPTPNFSHIPIITDALGNKLSKQSLAKPIDEQKPSQTLFLLLQLLRQQPPKELVFASVTEILSWAIEHWRPQVLMHLTAIPETATMLDS